MPAYAVVIREKTRNPAKLDEYKKLVPASFQKHPMKFLALHGRSEVLEGPKCEEIIILEFPATKRRKPGITARNMRPHANTASRAETTVSSSPRVSPPNNRRSWSITVNRLLGSTDVGPGP